MLKLISVFIFILFANPLFASGKTIQINQTIHKESHTYSTSVKGIALSIASSQHHFDFGTHQWQGSLGAGTYDGTDAVSFALGKRIDRMLLNISLGIEEGKTGVGVGLNWRF